MLYVHVCLWSSVEQNHILSKMLFMFMPFFFFKSGMFFREGKTFKQTLVAGTKRLVVPYVVFSFVGWFLFLLRDVANDGLTTLSLLTMVIDPLRLIFHEGALAGNSPLWFLMSLFAVKMLSCFFLMNKTLCILSVCMTGGTAYILNRVGLDSYYYLSNICSGCFFFEIGYLLKEFQYCKTVLVASAIVYISIIFLIPTSVDMHTNQFFKGSYIAWLASSTAGIVMLDNVARLRWLRNCRSLQLIGRNSMTVYVTHWPVMCLAQIVASHTMDNEIADFKWFSIYTVALILILPLLNKILNQPYCKWMIGV